MDVDSDKQYFSLRKLAFISILFNQIEYGLECLKASRTLECHSNNIAKVTKLRYIEFLKELESEEINIPKIFPKTFGTVFSIDDSKNRFVVNKNLNKSAKLKKLIKAILGSHRIYSYLQRSLRDFIIIIYNTQTLFSKFSRFERIFLNNGLNKQASLLRKRRTYQKKFGYDEKL